jgi:hypothetical protein
MYHTTQLNAESKAKKPHHQAADVDEGVAQTKTKTTFFLNFSFDMTQDYTFQLVQKFGHIESVCHF